MLSAKKRKGTLFSACAKTNVSDTKTSIVHQIIKKRKMFTSSLRSVSRLVKAEKVEFTIVNEHFSDEPDCRSGRHNEEIGVFA